MDMTPDLRLEPPPADWGVDVDVDAIDSLADRWAGDTFVLPAFDYPGTPADRDEAGWYDYVTLSVSVLACLWAPETHDIWHVEYDGAWLDDAPGVFAAFTKALNARPQTATGGPDLAWFAELSDGDGAELFAGRGTLLLIPERVDTLRGVATTLIERWDSTARNLVEEAGRDGRRIVELLIETMPGYRDRPSTSAGVLRFDKLAHLAAAIMAAGQGWSAAGFTGFDDFPVYPDYMLPRVFRHHGAMVYGADLASAVDQRLVIDADSPAEHAIRWATVFCGHRLGQALAQKGNPVTAPALDYRLWSEAVLGPDADAFGEHHRTITLRY